MTAVTLQAAARPDASDLCSANKAVIVKRPVAAQRTGAGSKGARQYLARNPKCASQEFRTGPHRDVLLTRHHDGPRVWQVLLQYGDDPFRVGRAVAPQEKQTRVSLSLRAPFVGTIAPSARASHGIVCAARPSVPFRAGEARTCFHLVCGNAHDRSTASLVMPSRSSAARSLSNCSSCAGVIEGSSRPTADPWFVEDETGEPLRLHCRPQCANRPKRVSEQQNRCLQRVDHRGNILELALDCVVGLSPLSPRPRRSIATTSDSSCKPGRTTQSSIDFRSCHEPAQYGPCPPDRMRLTCRRCWLLSSRRSSSK